jgi:hypothetical protein
MAGPGGALLWSQLLRRQRREANSSKVGETLSQKQNTSKGTRGMAQVVEWLASMCKALVQSLVPKSKKKINLKICVFIAIKKKVLLWIQKEILRDRLHSY